MHTFVFLNSKKIVIDHNHSYGKCRSNPFRVPERKTFCPIVLRDNVKSTRVWGFVEKRVHSPGADHGLTDDDLCADS